MEEKIEAVTTLLRIANESKVSYTIRPYNGHYSKIIFHQHYIVKSTWLDEEETRLITEKMKES